MIPTAGVLRPGKFSSCSVIDAVDVTNLLMPAEQGVRDAVVVRPVPVAPASSAHGHIEHAETGETQHLCIYQQRRCLLQ